jgi:hypothetical protein
MDQTRASAEGLPRIFNQAVQGLARLGNFKMPSAKALKDLFSIATQKGRMLTIPEIKAVIRAELNPADIRRMPAQLQRQFRTAIKIRVTADTKAGASAVGDLVGKLKGGTQKVKITAQADTKQAKAAFQALRTPITKTVNLKTSVDPTTFGAQISAGIEAGLRPIHQQVIEDVIKNPITKAIRSHSPSLWARDEVGVPIVQGIALGILGQKGTIEKAATASITFFESAAIQKAQEAKKKISDALLIGDISMQAKTLTQFNNAISKLGRRRVPRELVDQLAALGPDQAKFISQIANMSEKELRRYVAAWQKANNQVKRSMRATAEDIKSSIKDAIQTGVDNLQNMFSQISDTQTQNFGGIFDGLDSMIGEGFKQAMDEYNNQMADFRNQIADLNGQLVDAQREAAQRLADAIAERKTQLQQAFGQLFSGSWITGADVTAKLDWGQKLGFDDLEKDLEAQVAKFKHWRDDLTSLAGKVPADLAQQLEDLGPDAVDQLDILNNATDEQLQQYIQTWLDGQNAINAVANKTTVDTSDITARINDILTQIDVVTQKMGSIEMPHQLTGEDIINNLKAQQDQWIEYQGVLQQLIDKGLPMDLIEQLQEMGPQALPYMKALNSMSAEQLKTLADTWDENHKLIYEASVKALNTQLQLWFNYGVNIARNIISGIKSQGDYLADYFAALIKSMLEGVGPPAPPPPPNPVNPKPPFPVGNTGTGGSDGGLGKFESSGAPNTQINLHEGAVTVIAHQDESLQSTLERTAFRLTTKVPG